jgi:hypothetical protein
MTDLYRCLCGLNLWKTEQTANPAAWARHIAHIEAFQQGRNEPVLWTAAVAWQTQGPCARCGKDCERYGEHGGPLCADCAEVARG